MSGGDEEEGDDATVFRPAGGSGSAARGFPPAVHGQTKPPPPGIPVSPAPAWPDSPAAAVATGPGSQSGAPSGEAQQIEFTPGEPELFGPEPIVAAAGRLILLANHIRTLAMGPDLELLRRTTVGELDAFTKRARTLGLEARSVQLAHYILCAFIDDAVMSTPWGGSSQWSKMSLLVVYHKDARGGDRMFQFAEKMERDPESEPRLISLLYLCLSLGFEGRAALDPRGQTMLGQRRAGLAALVRRQNGDQAAEISPQWQGRKVQSGRFAEQIPLWTILAGIGIIGLAVFASLLLHLSSRSTAAIEAVDRAVGTEALPPAAPPPPQAQTPLYEKFQDILRPDVAAGRLELTREGNAIIIRLHNVGLFSSAQAEASRSWSDTFAHLSQAANLTTGPIRLEGHTDDQAIRSLQFPSNQELSEARAKSVGEALGSAGLSDPSRLHITGFGSTRPIADNATEEGRTSNRRVELRVANTIDWR